MRMPFIRRWLSPMLLAPLTAWAQGSVVATAEVRAELVAHAPEGVAPRKPEWLGLLLQHAPHWHTDWKNPGDSGLPTLLDWQVPTGLAAGAIQWPTPQRLPGGPLINSGYEGRVLLPVPLTMPAGLGSDPLAVWPPADLADWMKGKNAVPTATLDDADGKVGRAYGARTTPHMYVIDPLGRLVYAGAIDSKPSASVSDIKTATNYVNRALGEAPAGKPVSQAQTMAYGCSIKYARAD
jgi:hypothetical protein